MALHRALPRAAEAVEGRVEQEAPYDDREGYSDDDQDPGHAFPLPG
jgi:hypothetical protein